MATVPASNTPEWYAYRAADIKPGIFLCLRDPANGINGDACHIEWSPGDMTLYQLVLTRWRSDLAVALLNCEQRCGVVPFLAEDQHPGYVGGALKITNGCTAGAVTAIINAATMACLGRPTMAV